MTLREAFLSSFAAHSDRIALVIGDTHYSYAQLLARASVLGANMESQDTTGSPIALIGNHAIEVYCGVIAAILTERPYVPVNPKFPVARQASVIRRSGAIFLLSDAREDISDDVRTAFPPSSILQLPSSNEATEVRVIRDASPVSYIMFTSGTTGEPKGVMVYSRNLLAYCTAFAKIAEVRPDDRCTQLFDLSFDLSVHDMLVTWLSGAALVVATGRDLLDPVGFAAREGITCWFSVPSVAAMAKRFRRLKRGTLPDLRLALFCGEALPSSLARDFMAASPNARTINVYGPTEATIAITAYDLDDATLPNEPVVPIGRPYPGSEVVLVDAALNPAMPGETGELLLGGPQITAGYLNNAETTSAKFINRTFPDLSSKRWYRSGDIGKFDEHHGFIFQGRIDDQVKINGYRIEVAEIEECLREDVQGEIVVVAVPATGNSMEHSLAVAVAGAEVTFSSLKERARRSLPDYMIPAEFISLDALPLNANGKVDRRAIAEHIVAARTRD
jgi:amino acid adenylation domain-containing protein